MNAVVFDAIKALLDEGKIPTVALTKSQLDRIEAKLDRLLALLEK